MTPWSPFFCIFWPIYMSYRPRGLGDWFTRSTILCVQQGANDLHMVQLMPLPPCHLCFSKIQNGWSFWYQPTQVVLEKRPLNGCVCVCKLSRDSLECWFFPQVCLITVSDIILWCFMCTSHVGRRLVSTDWFTIVICVDKHEYCNDYSINLWTGNIHCCCWENQGVHRTSIRS